MSTNLSQKIPPIFECKDCDYSTCSSKDFKKHTETKKHIRNIYQHLSTDFQPEKMHFCKNCDKAFKERTGLWRHKKKCNFKMVDQSLPTDKELMMHFIKNNTEIQQMMMELIKNGINNTNCNNTTNNKTFNLNLYLNETCKDAMNITDFVNSINLSLEDLENTGRKGYVEGISTIFLKNLNNIEHHMRPIHCSDQKREIIYIKDNDKWEKECYEKPILTKAIKNVAVKNIKQIKFWRDKHPDCTLADSTKNDLYLKIVSNSMNGLTEEECKKNINKIISNVAKEVGIDKS
jgi:hypothetical protein